ncbi:MAG: hypothetical protein ACOX0T_09975 [Pelotomaculum sp.]|jgi:hypothetical protein
MYCLFCDKSVKIVLDPLPVEKLSSYIDVKTSKVCHFWASYHRELTATDVGALSLEQVILVKLRALKFLGLLCFCFMALVLVAGCNPWGTETNPTRPLVIKPEDFSLFLFESSEEIYRANIKDPAMWEGLKVYAEQDPDYALHYNWLYTVYNGMDERRRGQLKAIMEQYHPQTMNERLLQKGKQEADLQELLAFIAEDSFFSSQRGTLLDFYTWYGTNWAGPHYAQIKPLLQQKAQLTKELVGQGFDLNTFFEKETDIKLKKKPDNIELLLTMRIYGCAGYYRDRDSLTTIQWNCPPEKVWLVPFNEVSAYYFRTFTGDWNFKYLVSRLKKDEQLMEKYKEDVPYTWDGWIEANLTEGFARYLLVRKGITRDVGDGIYIFDEAYARALAAGFDPDKTTLKDFTMRFLKHKYDI